jgi:hypothetical protein
MFGTIRHLSIPPFGPYFKKGGSVVSVSGMTGFSCNLSVGIRQYNSLLRQDQFPDVTSIPVNSAIVRRSNVFYKEDVTSTQHKAINVNQNSSKG